MQNSILSTVASSVAAYAIGHILSVPNLIRWGKILLGKFKGN